MKVSPSFDTGTCAASTVRARQRFSDVTALTHVMNNRTNLVGRTSVEIGELLTSHVDHEYRVRQVAQWIIDRNVSVSPK